MTEVSSRDSMDFHLREGLNLPDAAAVWLLDLWDVTQTLDDIVDGDEVSRDAAMALVVKTLFTMPSNQFYAANAGILQPVIATAILKWKASDDAERAGAADEKSFIWRASYYDVILTAVIICHGWDTAMKNAVNVMKLYGESYISYKEEFSRA